MREEKPKFAKVIAQHFIQEQTQRRMFGKPYITTAAYLGVCGFLFQQCALLGRLYSDKNLVSFIYVFMAQKGKELIDLGFSDRLISEEIAPFMDEAKSFQDLLLLRERARLNSSDNFLDFYTKYGRRKIDQIEATKFAAKWAVCGGCLGVKEPDFIADLFEASYQPSPLRDRAYELGVVNTPKPLSFEDAEREASEMFKEFCEQFYPELLLTLF